LGLQFGDEGQVVFAGYKSDAIPYMQKFHDWCNNTSDSEGFSYDSLNIMAAGVPVLLTRRER